jgi:hypothetical protein|nr:hypothetical protein [Clostridia bacterium]
MELYIKLGWPEYQEYQEKEGFDENSEYSPESDSYFIYLDWYKANK